MESITCPGCQKTIRIPDDVLGLRAQCPFCKCHFRAPQRTADGLAEPQLVRRNPLASRLTLAGTVLLFIGLIGFFSNGVLTLQSFLAPEEFAKAMRDAFEGMAEKSEDGDRIRAQIPAIIKWRPWITLVSGLLSLGTAAGAIAMLRQRYHGLAVTGCFLTMLNAPNMANCCCFAGVFLGGWALYVVLNPAVRAEFQPASGTA